MWRADSAEASLGDGTERSFVLREDQGVIRSSGRYGPSLILFLPSNLMARKEFIVERITSSRRA
jgi:hypothetical protein